MTRSVGTDSGPPAALVSVGDELLFGETEDSNSGWLARQLSSMGFRVVRREAVADRPREIENAVGLCLEEAELVLVTGGLGPTPDDRTKEAVSRVFRTPLQSDPVLLKQLQARYRALGLDAIPSGSERMALVPEGSLLLSNPVGAAPGLLLRSPEDRLCILLPGVPREMRAIFTERVRPLLQEALGEALRPVVHRLIHTTGVPESVLSEQLSPLLPAGDDEVSVAFLPFLGGVRVRLSARKGRDPESASDLLDIWEAKLNPVLDQCRYRAPSGDLAEAVGVGLLEAGLDVAVAESCTGGIIAKRLTDHAGASGYLRGCVVAYSNSVKESVLGVSPHVLGVHGAVSREAAEAMATEAAKLMGAAVGIGVTGIAGPTGGTKEKPVGTVCYAVAVGKEIRSRREVFPGDREAIRERAAQAALGLLLRLLEQPGA